MPRVSSSSSSSRRSWGAPLLWVACCVCSVRAHLEVQLSEGPITYASLGGSVSITCHYRRVRDGPELAAPDAAAAPDDDDDPPGWAAGDVPEVRFGVVGRGGVRRSDVAAARGLETLVRPALEPRVSLATDGGGPWGGAATLTLSGLRDADAGLYVCEVAVASHSARATTRLLVDGVVFHYRAAAGRYALTLAGARQACTEQGGRLASPAQLAAAHSGGLHQCDAGWLCDGTVRYPIVDPRASCESDKNGFPGIRSYGVRDASEAYDAYCYAEKLQGEVLHVSAPGRFSLSEAHRACAEHGATAGLATVGSLQLARKAGLDRCDAGWLADGSARFPVVRPRPGCGGGGGGPGGVRAVHRHGNHTGFPAPDSRYAAYCHVRPAALEAASPAASETHDADMCSPPLTATDYSSGVGILDSTVTETDYSSGVEIRDSTATDDLDFSGVETHDSPLAEMRGSPVTVVEMNGSPFPPVAETHDASLTEVHESPLTHDSPMPELYSLPVLPVTEMYDVPMLPVTETHDSPVTETYTSHDDSPITEAADSPGGEIHDSPVTESHSAPDFPVTEYDDSPLSAATDFHDLLATPVTETYDSSGAETHNSPTTAAQSTAALDVRNPPAHGTYGSPAAQTRPPPSPAGEWQKGPRLEPLTAPAVTGPPGDRWAQASGAPVVWGGADGPAAAGEQRPTWTEHRSADVERVAHHRSHCAYSLEQTVVVTEHGSPELEHSPPAAKESEANPYILNQNISHLNQNKSYLSQNPSLLN
ncbi:unnamed protein product [Lampetra fluviatilis]